MGSYRKGPQGPFLLITKCMLELHLDTMTIEELLEKQNKLVELIPMTGYNRRAQLQDILRAYTNEIAKRKQEAKAANKKQ